jgi:hypothetical protein
VTNRYTRLIDPEDEVDKEGAGGRRERERGERTRIMLEGFTMGFDQSAALRHAHDEILSALSAEDPTTTLRTLAIEIASGPLGRTGVEAAFVTVCEELAEQGREEESTLVAYVLDMIAEW